MPTITPFCSELTGITQDMVEEEPEWEKVMEMFLSWYNENNLSPDNSTFVTCGLWDLNTMLPKQCQYSGLSVPDIMSGDYVNIKHSFQNHAGKYAKVNTN